MTTLNLPVAGGKIAAYTLQPPKSFAPPQTPFNRVAYAANCVGEIIATDICQRIAKISDDSSYRSIPADEAERLANDITSSNSNNCAAHVSDRISDRISAGDAVYAVINCANRVAACNV